MNYRHGLKRKVRGDVGKCGPVVTDIPLLRGGVGWAGLCTLEWRHSECAGECVQSVWGPPWDRVTERATLLPLGLLWSLQCLQHPQKAQEGETATDSTRGWVSPSGDYFCHFEQEPPSLF